MKEFESFIQWLNTVDWILVKDEFLFWFVLVVVIGGLFWRILYVVFVTAKNVSRNKAHDFKDPIVEKIMKEKPGISHAKAHAIAEAIREEGVHAQESEG